MSSPGTGSALLGGFADSPTHGEAPPPSEAVAIATIVQAIETRVRAAALASPPARRDAHPKAHGCVRAEFTILPDLPPSLRAGVFAEARTFQAWIRFSNGSEKPAPDKIGDGRGMAVKLMDVAGSASGTQDFVMINHPVFFVRDAADYVAFQTAANPLGFFFPGFNPFQWRLHELWIARSITGKTVQNPLNIQYWSMTPYALGDAVCKYSARPSGGPSTFVATDAADFLHDNLAAHLTEREATFDFLAQPRPIPAASAIEDPTAEWDDKAIPFIPVARITIPRQGFDSDDQHDFCENLSFTPWHGLPAHQPLGGINRVRRTVYETISRLRHELNGRPRQEPTAGPNSGRDPYV